jgi:hypothetical protein
VFPFDSELLSNYIFPVSLEKVLLNSLGSDKSFNRNNNKLVQNKFELEEEGLSNKNTQDQIYEEYKINTTFDNDLFPSI